MYQSVLPLSHPQSTTAAMASLGASGDPLSLTNLLSKAARLRKCIAFRVPSEKGKVNSSDLYYLTTETAFKQASDADQLPVPAPVPLLFSFGDKKNQFLRLKSKPEKSTYNRLFNRKDQWIKLAGPGQCEVQLVSPVGELPGHISWKEMEEKVELYKPDAAPAPPALVPTPATSPIPIPTPRKKPCPKSKKIVYQDDTVTQTPLTTTPKTSMSPNPIATYLLSLSASKNKNSLVRSLSVEPAVQEPADPQPDPTWMQLRNRPASPANGEEHVIAADVIHRPPTPPPVVETVTIEDAPEEEVETPPPQVPTPAPRVTTPVQREPRVRIQNFDEIMLAPPEPRDPRDEPFIPAVESITDPDVSRLGSLFAEMDNLSLSILRHTDLMADGRFAVLPLAKGFQVPSMKRIANEDLVNELNSIFRKAAEKASRALVIAQVEAAKVIRAEASTLASSRDWTEDDVDAAQAIRLSRQDRLKPYKPSDKPAVTFFQLLDGAIKPHGSAAVAHTTAGRKSDNVAPAQPGNTASPKKKKNRRKKKNTPAPAAAAADPVAAAPAAPAVAPPAPAASERTQKRKNERSGNGQQPRQTGNRGNAPRTSVFERLGPVHTNHWEIPENKKLLARTRQERQDYCRRFNVPLNGFKSNADRLEAIIACRPTDYQPTTRRVYDHRQTASGANEPRRNQESTYYRNDY